MIRPWAAGLIGVIGGPVVLTQIAFWDHVRRYQTGSEFWAGFITVAVGIASEPSAARFSPGARGANPAHIGGSARRWDSW